MLDSSGNTRWQFDVRGRTTQETRYVSGTGGGTFVTQWGYDAADRPAWQKYLGGSAGQIGEQVNSAYTAQGLLDTVSGAATYVGDTQYNVRGQVTERRLGGPDGVVRQLYAYTQVANFRLVGLRAGTATTYDNRQKLTYTYDQNGNLLTSSDAAAYDGDATPATQDQTFIYDPLDRLQSAQTTGGGGTFYGDYAPQPYAYSSAGNLTHFNSATQNLYYEDAAHKHALTHIGGTAPENKKYRYDYNGNATRRIAGSQDITLAYDAENRLTGMSGGVTSSYVCDGDGTRVKETISGVTRVFVGAYYEVDNGRRQEVLLRRVDPCGGEQRHVVLPAQRSPRLDRHHTRSERQPGQAQPQQP
jgi:YD repeat-containing protein